MGRFGVVEHRLHPRLSPAAHPTPLINTPAMPGAVDCEFACGTGEFSMNTDKRCARCHRGRRTAGVPRDPPRAIWRRRGTGREHRPVEPPRSKRYALRAKRIRHVAVPIPEVPRHRPERAPIERAVAAARPRVSPDPRRLAGSTSRSPRSRNSPTRPALDIPQHGWAFAVGAAEQEHAEPTVMLGHLGVTDIVA